MHQERYYTFVGIFVVGALCLMIFTARFLYKEYLVARHDTYVMFFQGSLTGLKITSKVTYRGVKIGEVKLIEIAENKDKTEVEIPVYVDFLVARTFGAKYHPVDILIKKGYAATVMQTNFLTGDAEIALIPSAKSTEISSAKKGFYNRYPIFPTIENKKTTSFSDALTSVKITLNTINDLLQSKEVAQVIKQTRAMADSIEKLANNLDLNTPPFIAYFTQALTQFSKAANSFENLTDYLSRHPESLLRGKS
ncbi:putative transmembrane protein [Legionella santicrucis]|uniref:Putative transmembrane protein n=1 Tax=Legionella santicrucis TaxID=45074 RepID=A0A0W0YAV5_9GAMM|nr:MlaD family protein [Legionella santicrucis]KTD53758.1 putative transmembrane protein [Legionella santicrucis]